MDWLEHLDQVTRFDGFLAALVEIRDGMVFYDRDLMLAGYTGNLEALIVSTLAEACMAGDEEASRAFAAVRQVVDELPERLAAPDDAPADVQAVVGRILADLHEQLRGIEQGLRRDATHAQARAAEPVLLFHASHAHAQLGRAQGRHIATGAGAEHDEIDRHRRPRDLKPRAAAARAPRAAP